ncbi:MAG TPA: hypothetical protein VFU27_01530 [Terriglobales bacterium]|nr:hypothetical protein [Terriglobales bacterium]
MSFLSARDFTLVMLAIVFLAGAGSIALLTPLPSPVNGWAAAGLSTTALLMLFLAIFSKRWGHPHQEEQHASPPSGRSAP